MLIAIGIGWDGRRQILGVELANRESRGSWEEFLAGLRERGLHGVEFVVSDDHDGLVKAIREVLSEAGGSRSTDQQPGRLASVVARVRSGPTGAGQ